MKREGRRRQLIEHDSRRRQRRESEQENISKNQRVCDYTVFDRAIRVMYTRGTRAARASKGTPSRVRPFGYVGALV